MNGCDDDLLRRLPLPLARLYRQAVDAAVPLNRHQAAYFLWEASLKLLGSTAIAVYAESADHDEGINEQLKDLARPSLGHWWGFARLLVPLVAKLGDNSFEQSKKLLLGKRRTDLRRAAALDALLRQTLAQEPSTDDGVRVQSLFDRLVRYRNRELGHGAAGQRAPDFYQRHADALLTAAPDILGQLDVLIGRRLVYVAEVKRLPNGGWGVECEELVGETPRPFRTLEFPPNALQQPPGTHQLYLAQALTSGEVALAQLHPLAIYDAETAEFFFMNSHREAKRVEYLCYNTGKVEERNDLGADRTKLFTRLFGAPVDEQQVDQWAAATLAEEPAWTLPAGHSRTIGGFPLISKLGQGGMAVVYRAWQPSLGRQVALKCLLKHGDKGSEDRFAREVRALGRVTHPNLVKVYTSGVHEEQYYYAMELLDGATLGAVSQKLAGLRSSVADIDLKTWRNAVTTVCEETRQQETRISTPEDVTPALPLMPAEEPTTPKLVDAGDGYVRRIVELIRQTAEAAHALHEAQAIHRDIKPENIMVSPDGTSAVLMDLGLAQLADEADGKLTRTRQFVGTLRYASPEQVMAVTRLDCRTDVYSLGATLWELLTLQPMFAATDATPTPQLMLRIPVEEPKPVRTFCPDVSPDLEAIVMKCLEKDPQQRYATARALADDLGNWLRGEPVAARRRTLRQRAWRALRKQRRLVAAVIALVVLQVGVVAAMYHWRDNLSPSAGANPPANPAVPSDDPPAAEPNAILTPGTLASAPARNLIAPTAPAGGRLYALLVGCTKYDHLPPEYQLEGPLNDVALWQSLLIGRFGVLPQNIKTLTAEGPRDRQPTRAHILAELDVLQAFCREGDAVMVLLAGNGSIDPATEERCFLPADFDAARPKETCLTTGQVSMLLGRICQRDVEVRLVIDAGFSDEMIPGALPAVLRYVPPLYRADTGLPEEPPAKRLPVDPAPETILAAQNDMPTLELSLPPGVGDTKYGLLSYTLAQIVDGSAVPSSTAELVQRVHDQYVAWGYAAIVPRLESPRRDRELKDIDWSAERPRFRLARAAEGSMMIDSGSLNGLTADSILAVYPGVAGGAEEKALGYVRVKADGVRPSLAVVEPCAFADLPAVKDFPAAATCSVVFSDYELKIPKLSFEIADDDSTAGPQTAAGQKDRAARLQKQLQQISEKLGGLVSIDEDSRNADWIVRCAPKDNGDAYLVPAQGLPGLTDLKQAAPTLGPIAGDAQLADWLEANLPRIARSQSLLQVAYRSTQVRARVPGARAPQLSIELRKSENAQAEGTPLVWSADGRPILAGEYLKIKVMSHGQAASDVTVLFVDSNYAMSVFFPRPGQLDNRLEPGTSIDLGGKVNDKTLGWEHLIVIAAPSDGPPVDFSFAAQTSLDAARTIGGTRGLEGGALESPLGNLLQTGLFGAGEHRGLDPAKLADYYLAVEHWEVVTAEPADK